MLAPKGYTQDISKEAYIAAHKVAEEKNGMLRFTKPAWLLIAAVILGAGITVYNGYGIAAYYVSAGSMILLAISIAGLLRCLPKMAKFYAECDYESFKTLSNPAQVTFESDEMHFQSEMLTRRVEYAKTRLCIETADRFVIVTDDDAMIILEKSCFAEPEATTAFLRDVFARWYKRG